MCHERASCIPQPPSCAASTGHCSDCLHFFYALMLIAAGTQSRAKQASAWSQGANSSVECLTMKNWYAWQGTHLRAAICSAASSSTAPSASFNCATCIQLLIHLHLSQVLHCCSTHSTVTLTSLPLVPSLIIDCIQVKGYMDAAAFREVCTARVLAVLHSRTASQSRVLNIKTRHDALALAGRSHRD